MNLIVLDDKKEDISKTKEIAENLTDELLKTVCRIDIQEPVNKLVYKTYPHIIDKKTITYNGVFTGHIFEYEYRKGTEASVINEIGKYKKDLLSLMYPSKCVETCLNNTSLVMDVRELDVINTFFGVGDLEALKTVCEGISKAFDKNTILILNKISSIKAKEIEKVTGVHADKIICNVNIKSVIKVMQ